VGCLAFVGAEAVTVSDGARLKDGAALVAGLGLWGEVGISHTTDPSVEVEAVRAGVPCLGEQSDSFEVGALTFKLLCAPWVSVDVLLWSEALQVVDVVVGGVLVDVVDVMSAGDWTMDGCPHSPVQPDGSVFGTALEVSPIGQVFTAWVSAPSLAAPLNCFDVVRLAHCVSPMTSSS
jgi:hypothetical protein